MMTEETKNTLTIYEPQDALDALDKLATLAHKSELNSTFDENAAHCLAFMNRHYGFTKIQAVVVALLIDAGKALTNSNFSAYIGLRNAQMLRYNKEILDLVKDRVLVRTKERDGHSAYNVRSEAIRAFCNNERLMPRKVKGLSESEFFQELECIFKDLDENIIEEEEFTNRLSELLRENEGLSVCSRIRAYDLSECNVKILLYVANQFVSHSANSVCVEETFFFFAGEILCRSIRDSFAQGWNDLLQKGILECKSEVGLVDTDNISLTFRAKEELLQGLGLQFTDSMKYAGLKSATEIPTKHLFYNERETEAVSQLTRLLDEEHFSQIQARLEAQGMRKGFACLFYGGPGTGKTETVLQIARQTGRDIMQVDISTIREKYVGETEKRVKSIFDSYRKALNLNDKAPILLINEADAIICRRNTNTDHAVDKMENAMQNILLEEIEKFEGILIATTNLTDNMDSAFSRRFLYKICFERPTTLAKTAIWKSMLPRLSIEECTDLASHYDLSGGQIENIVRKQTVDYILNGEYATLPQMHAYCKAELVDNHSQRRRIGF